MLELDERTRRDLDQMRTRQAPSAAAKQRMYAALELQLGSGPDGGDLDGDAPGGSGDVGLATSKVGLGYAVKAVGATLALTVVGLVGVRGAVLGARALGDRPSAEHPSPSEPTAVSAPQQPNLAPPPLPPPPGPAEPSTLEAEAGDPEAPAPTARKPQPASKATSEPSANSLAAEMALLEQANAARDLESKLTLLDRHADRFANGQLADEREILRIEALCELDELERAGAVARRFLAKRPNSPLRARIQRACPKLTVAE